MAWARLDDAFWRNPKVLAAGNEAAGLYARALSFAADNGTAGLLTTDTVKTLAGSRWKALGRKLVDVGLWDDLGPQGWHIHDYDDPAYGNPATPKARARSESARRAAMIRHHGPPGDPPPDANGMRNACETHTDPHCEPHADQMPLRAQAGASQSQSPFVGSSLRDGPKSRNAREDPDHHDEDEQQEQLAAAVHALQPSWQLGKIRQAIIDAREKAGAARVTAAMLIVAVANDSQSPRRVLTDGYWWNENDTRYSEALESPKLAAILEGTPA